MNREKIIIVDYGSQFTQLIARKVRELGAYSEIINFSKMENLRKDKLLKHRNWKISNKKLNENNRNTRP